MILKEPDDYATLHEQIIAGDKPAPRRFSLQGYRYYRWKQKNNRLMQRAEQLAKQVDDVPVVGKNHYRRLLYTVLLVVGPVMRRWFQVRRNGKLPPT